jgi:hypothetical protein
MLFKKIIAVQTYSEDYTDYTKCGQNSECIFKGSGTYVYHQACIS